jgi:hypothetical protein
MFQPFIHIQVLHEYNIMKQTSVSAGLCDNIQYQRKPRDIIKINLRLTV